MRLSRAMQYCQGTTLVLTASFQHMLGRPVSKCQNILGFAAATDDTVGSGDNWKFQSNHHHQHTTQSYFYRPHAQPTVSKH